MIETIDLIGLGVCFIIGLVFLANILVIFVIIFLKSQYDGLWLVVMLFAAGEVLLGARLHKNNKMMPESISYNELEDLIQEDKEKREKEIQGETGLK